MNKTCCCYSQDTVWPSVNFGNVWWHALPRYQIIPTLQQQNTIQITMPDCRDRSGLIRLDPWLLKACFFRLVEGLGGLGMAGAGSSPIDRRWPLVSTGAGAHGSSMRPLYQPPLLRGQCTRRSYLMSALVQKTQGAAQPTPCVVQRMRDRSGPSFRRTHVTTRCCGTPCLRATTSHAISSLLGQHVLQSLALGRQNVLHNTSTPTHQHRSHLRSAQQRWLLVVASSDSSSFDF